jgi:hypothetical protein
MSTMALLCESANCTSIGQPITRPHLLDHILKSIPTKITDEHIALLPTRADFIDKNLKAAFDHQIREKKPILFLPNTIHEKPEWNATEKTMKHIIYIFGITPCGTKTCVILDDVKVYADVCAIGNVQEFTANLREQLFTANIRYKAIEDAKMYPLKGFTTEKLNYKRVIFDSLLERKRFLDWIKLMNKSLTTDRKYKTASDDTGGADYYFQTIARYYRFATADWNRIEEYESVNSEIYTTNCPRVLKVHCKDIKKLKPNKRTEYGKKEELKRAIERDQTMVCQWDIETWRSIANGLVPTPADTDFTIFMVCSAYFWHWSPTPLYSVCVVNVETGIHPNTLVTIVCKNETSLLKTHVEVVSRMAPDILSAFNGSNFDWPLLREKLKRNNLLVYTKSKLSSLPLTAAGKYSDTEALVDRFNFGAEKVKIDAETTDVLACVAKFPGILDTDVAPVFKKFYPKMEVGRAKSLNYYLARNDLPSKEDMPYKRMFKIYERAIALQKAPKICHCDTPCAVCNSTLPEIDCVEDLSDPHNPRYSKTLHDDIIDVCC